MIGRFGGVGTHGLDIAAALERLLGIPVFPHSAFVTAGRQPFCLGGVGGRLGGFRVLQKGASQFVLSEG